MPAPQQVENGNGGGEASARGAVVIDAERVTKDGREWVSVTVSDDGPGIDPRVLPHLFEPFVSTRLDARGTGLGLAVADGIVREHGGVILARNRAERSGAVFEVLIPVSGAAGPVEQSGIAATSGEDSRSLSP